MWVTVAADGIAALHDKFLTVRLINGQLSGSAKRLDVDAPEASVPAGYGDIGFQAFGMDFSEPGCWQITQRLSGKELRFTVWVVRGQG